MWTTTTVNWTSEMETVFKELDGMFDSILKENKLGTPVDYADEDAKNYHISVPAPGFKKSDITVSVEGRSVSIKGVSSHSKLKNKLNYYFTAPKPIAGSNVEAHLEDGVLVVTIPKASDTQTINVQVR